MNKYLHKIASILSATGKGALKTELGIPSNQQIPGQTLQALSGSEGIARKQASGALNLRNKGTYKIPARPTSKLRQPLPEIKK